MNHYAMEARMEFHRSHDAGLLLLSIVPMYALFRSWQCGTAGHAVPAAGEHRRD